MVYCGYVIFTPCVVPQQCRYIPSNFLNHLGSGKMELIEERDFAANELIDSVLIRSLHLIVHTVRFISSKSISSSFIPFNFYFGLRIVGRGIH